MFDFQDPETIKVIKRILAQENDDWSIEAFNHAKNDDTSGKEGG